MSSPSQAEARLGLLGPTELVVAGRVVPLPSRAERAILTALGLVPGVARTVEALAHDIWGDERGRSWRKNIHVRISRVRGRIDAVVPDAGSSVVATAVDGYQLRLDPEDVDAARFEQLLGSGRRALGDGDARAAEQLLSECLDLWRGEPLVDLAESSAGIVEVGRLTELHHAATDAWHDAALLLGRHQEVAARLEAAIALDPLRERRWGQLMVALYRSGRQGDALRTYQRARTALDDELGIEPGPELRRLERAVLDQSLDLGARFAVSAPVADSPAPRQGSPTDLADPLAWARGQCVVDLVDRVGEREALTALWDEVRHQRMGGFAVVTGDTGSGKTRLAAELALQVEDDGGLVLAGRCTPGGGVMALVAAASPLGVTPPDEPLHAGSPGMLQYAMDLAGALMAEVADRPAVVILDDMQWADADLIAIVRALADRPVPFEQRIPLLGVMVRRHGVPLQRNWAGLEAAMARVPLQARIDLADLEPPGAGVLLDRYLPGAPLSPAAIDDLVHDVGGRPGYLVQVAEQVRTHGAPDPGTGLASLGVPESLRAAVTERLDLVGSSVLAVVIAGAVIGESFEVDRAAVGAGIDSEDALEALEVAAATRIVDESAEPDRYRFVSAIERLVVLERLSASRRRRIEGRLATLP